MNITDFLQIENKYHLYCDEIDGVNYWEYSRFAIWQYHICSEKLGLEKSQTDSDSACEAFKKVFSLGYHILFSGFLRSKSDICIINHERRVQSGKYFDCIYTEEIAAFYPNNIVLERPYKGRHLKPVRTHNLYYTDYIVVKANLYYLLQKKFRTNYYRSVKKKVKQKLEKPLTEIWESYQVKLSKESIYELVVKRILMYHIEYKAYCDLLKRIKPKLIVEVCHYSLHSMIINEIAGDLGIYTIELQHGTMHKDHIAYQYITDETVKQLPKKILTFSDYWNKYIRLPANIKVIAVGYPYFEQQIKSYCNYVKKDSYKKTILFISQGTIGLQLSKLAAELYDTIDKTKFHIIYKLHPGEYSGWQKRYPWLNRTEIEVVDNLNHNIYEYFAQSDFQIGVYSTAIYEGLGFGLQTMLYRIGHFDTMESLVDEGYAIFVDCVDDIVKKLALEQREKIKMPVFWKKDAMQNIRIEIDEWI